MRVLHVLHTSMPALNGYSVRSANIIENQAAQGIEPCVVTSARHPDDGSLLDHINGIAYYRTPAIREPRIPLLREAMLMRALRTRVNAAIAAFKPDIVHAHSPVLVGMPALQAARKHGLPFVYEIRDLWENASVDRGKFADASFLYRMARGAESRLVRSADGVVTICEQLRREIAGRTDRPESISVMPNGVDTEKFQPLAPDLKLMEQLGLRGKKIVGYLGTFQPYEGLKDLISAIPVIKAAVPEAHLLITGEDGQLPALRAQVAGLQLEDSVTFPGRVPHSEVRKMLAIASVMVYPRILTRVTALTTPLKPLEAMAMAIPVMVSDVPAMSELVADGETGVVFAAGNPADLAAKCIALLGDDARRRKLAQNGQVYVNQERTWSTLVRGYKDIYAAAMQRKQAA